MNIMAKHVNINLNPAVIDMEYAVRGPIPQRAEELRKGGLEIISCNIGNPQALGQEPISYYRDVQSLVINPNLLKKITSLTGGQKLFLDDAVREAERIVQLLPQGIGAYTKSPGLDFVRQQIAEFIDARDNQGQANFVAANPEHIYLTNGASSGVEAMIKIFMDKTTDTSGPTDGFMVPIPQYPLYSATITKEKGSLVGYYPDENKGWTITRDLLEESYQKAVKNGVDVKAIVIINPGNPTGVNMDAESIDEVIDFAQEKGLMIFSDEVYQENTYGGKFHSFAKQVGNKDVPLISFHSTSKGYIGECGQRGGYFEVRNPPTVNNSKSGETFMDLTNKLQSVGLCPNTNGQILTGLMVKEPTQGSAEYERFVQERDTILEALSYKSGRLKEAFSQMNGVEFSQNKGAMYEFPKLNLPSELNDFGYAMNMLEKTGLVTVNGKGFGLDDHVRVAFLPPKELLNRVLPQVIETHNAYVR